MQQDICWRNKENAKGEAWRAQASSKERRPQKWNCSARSQDSAWDWLEWSTSEEDGNQLLEEKDHWSHPNQNQQWDNEPRQWPAAALSMEPNFESTLDYLHSPHPMYIPPIDILILFIYSQPVTPSQDSHLNTLTLLYIKDQSLPVTLSFVPDEDLRGRNVVPLQLLHLLLHECSLSLLIIWSRSNEPLRYYHVFINFADTLQSLCLVKGDTTLATSHGWVLVSIESSYLERVLLIPVP